MKKNIKKGGKTHLLMITDQMKRFLITLHLRKRNI